MKKETRRIALHRETLQPLDGKATPRVNAGATTLNSWTSCYSLECPVE